MFSLIQRPKVNYACFEIEPFFHSKLYEILELPWVIYCFFVPILFLFGPNCAVPSVYSRRSLFYSKLHEILKLPWFVYWYFESCSGSDELCSFIRDGAFSIRSSMKFLNCHFCRVFRVSFWLGPNYARLFETEPFLNSKLYYYEILELNSLFLRLQLPSEVLGPAKDLKAWRRTLSFDVEL